MSVSSCVWVCEFVFCVCVVASHGSSSIQSTISVLLSSWYLSCCSLREGVKKTSVRHPHGGPTHDAMKETPVTMSYPISGVSVFVSLCLSQAKSESNTHRTNLQELNSPQRGSSRTARAWNTSRAPLSTHSCGRCGMSNKAEKHREVQRPSLHWKNLVKQRFPPLHETQRFPLGRRTKFPTPKHIHMALPPYVVGQARALSLLLRNPE